MPEPEKGEALGQAGGPDVHRAAMTKKEVMDLADRWMMPRDFMLDSRHVHRREIKRALAAGTFPNYAKA